MAENQPGGHRRAAPPLLAAADTAVLVGAALFLCLRLASGDLRFADFSRPFSALPAPLPLALFLTIALVGALAAWRLEFGSLSDAEARALVLHGILFAPLGGAGAVAAFASAPHLAAALPVLWCAVAGVSIAALVRGLVRRRRLQRVLDLARIASFVIAATVLAWSLGTGAAEQRFLDLDLLGACGVSLGAAAASLAASRIRRPSRVGSPGLGYVRAVRPTYKEAQR